MKIVDTTDNPWFDVGAIIIELDEDEHRILKKFAKIIGKTIYEILEDALYLTLGKYLDRVITLQQAKTLPTSGTG